ncbi:prephenate dehydrogenase/arogenate dehydrogenase family protein [Bremerella sp. JC817]|uniref:prephenate dehydrogenase n=1 Tax=Bremerella sp. JC817 TaxID=3231756 RepID=UPI00345ACF0D
MPEFQQIAIFGVGLIGGSIGLAARKHNVAAKVVGIGRSQEKLSRAQRLGCITEGTTDWQAGIRGADLVVVCSPVESIVPMIEQMVPFCQPGTIITDAGSTKQEIVDTLHSSESIRGRKDVYFVGSHPMAGSDKSGAEHAVANLFQDRVTIVTPVAETDRTAQATVRKFWESLGSTVMEMSPAQHDASVAVTSHMPHVIAALLAASTPESMLPLTSTGWGDTTRIAAGDIDLWRQILTTNRGHVLQSLANFEKLLTAFRASLEAGQDEHWIKLLKQGKHHRDIVGS